MQWGRRERWQHNHVCLRLERHRTHLQQGTLLMLPVLFNHSACKLSLSVHESPRLSAPRRLRVFLLSSPPIPPPLTLVSAEVYSGSLTLPASPHSSSLFPPSFSSSSVDMLYCTHAVCLCISTRSSELNFWGPSVECLDSVFSSCLLLKAFIPSNVAAELVLVVLLLRLHYEIPQIKEMCCSSDGSGGPCPLQSQNVSVFFSQKGDICT